MQQCIGQGQWQDEALMQQNWRLVAEVAFQNQLLARQPQHGRRWMPIMPVFSRSPYQAGV
jgi:hypothetical protein